MDGDVLILTIVFLYGLTVDTTSPERCVCSAGRRGNGIVSGIVFLGSGKLLGGRIGCRFSCGRGNGISRGGTCH